MKVAIRADSSLQIGTGHIMRCLSLATELRERGAEVYFLTQELQGSIHEVIDSNSFEFFLLPPNDPSHDAQVVSKHLKEKPIDWLIVDQYSFDKDWEIAVRSGQEKLLVIDDLANRKHFSELLLDQNFYTDANMRYQSLVESSCQTLLGPTYALLRPEFRSARKKIKPKNGRLEKILVNFGGVDPTGETTKVLKALLEFDTGEIWIDVVVGRGQQDKGKIETLCAALPNGHLHIQVTNMSKFMADSDLAIGAGGTSSWERCCLGLPSLVTCVAENQIKLVDDLAKVGAITKVGWHEDVKPKEYLQALMTLEDKTLRRQSQISSELVDGDGSRRVVSAMDSLQKVGAALCRG